MPPAGGRGKGGHSLSQKRMAPFRSPKRKVFTLQVSDLNNSYACGMKYLLGVLSKRLDLLLSSLPLPHLNEILVESIIPANIPIGEN